MSETRRIADQLKRAFEGEAWHGPALMEALAGITAQRAAARPVANAHSIREIVAHVAAWEDAVRRRLGEKVELTDAQDWPAVGDGERAWVELLERLERGNHALRDVILGFEDSRLDMRPGENRATAYLLMHGVIQHDLYHAGQISVLKKGTAA